MANVDITVSLVVPALPDNDIWFANNAAWQAYWANQNLQVSIPVADTNDYGVVKQANTVVFTPVALQPVTSVSVTYDPLGDGNFVTADVPDLTTYADLITQFLALQADHVALKQSLQNAGLINNI